MSRKLGHLLPLLALAFAGCGGLFGGGSNVTYYKVALSQMAPPQGSNCANDTSVVTTFRGIDGAGTVALYTLPGNNSYLLDTGSSGLEGTQANGGYSFSGTVLEDDKISNVEIKTTDQVTITLTAQGPGLTGSYTEAQSCNSSGSNGCGAPIGSQDGSTYQCTITASLVATQVPNPNQVTTEATSNPSAPSLGN